MVFDAISSNIDQSSHMLIAFGDLNILHKDWLTYSGETDRSGELCYISQTTLLRWLIFLLEYLWLEYLSHSCIFGFIFSFDASICSKMAVSIGKIQSCFCLSFHWLSFKLKTGCPFHCIAYDYSPADWDSLGDHLRDIPWENIFKLSASAAVSEFFEWI